MNAIHPSNRAVTLAALACLCMMLPAASAQTAEPEGPLPPPAVAPQSRLTVSPAEFEHWLAGLAPGEEPPVAAEPETQPSLVTPPPPPPTLVAPPPPPPTLVAPPSPSPKIAPAPAATPTPSAPAPKPAPVETPAPATTAPPEPAPPPAAKLPPVPTPPQPAEPTLTPPPAPVLQPPEQPQIATLPPDSRDTTPPAPTVEPLARPDVLKILYPEGTMEVPEAAKPDLDRLAAWLRQNPNVRLNIVGYASDPAEGGNQARRIALYRTLAVRKYLVDNGVLSTRMNVRALGDKTDELPRDRVEITLPPS